MVGVWLFLNNVDENEKCSSGWKLKEYLTREECQTFMLFGYLTNLMLYFTTVTTKNTDEPLSLEQKNSKNIVKWADVKIRLWPGKNDPGAARCSLCSCNLKYFTQ